MDGSAATGMYLGSILLPALALVAASPRLAGRKRKMSAPAMSNDAYKRRRAKGKSARAARKRNRS